MQIWLTGKSGAGKSTAAEVFSGHGYKIVDADKIAHKIAEKGGAAYDALCAAFPSVVLENGDIDRRALGRIVFSDSQKLDVLNRITHQYIIKEIHAACMGEKNVLIDAPLPNTFGVLCDKTVVITADRAKMVRRIMARDSISEADASLRVKTQDADKNYEADADAIVENDGDLGTFIQKIEKLAKEWYTA